MDTRFSTLAHAQYEVSLCENAVYLLILDPGRSIRHGFEFRAQCGNTVGEFRVMLDQFVVDIGIEKI